MPVGLPAPLPHGLVQLEWCASFSGPVREALHALKYRGERRLAGTLGAALAARWARAGRGGDVLVPVPVHPARRRERGFDQAADLALACGRSAGLPVEPLVVRRARTVAQHSLGRTARSDNTAGAFAIRPGAEGRVRGRWIVLVDDIVTTGATLEGCAVALAPGSPLAVSAIAVARER
jgi:ComF family protein